jgi:DNA/RNA endonuclease G (NUC1)
MKTMKLVQGYFFALILTSIAAYATIGAGLQMQLGNPSSATSNPTDHHHYLIQRDQYALDYSDVNGEPNWVSWDLTSADVGSSGRSNFIQDTTLPAGFYQVLTTDYSGSGYDRGHMCPSADRTVTAADNQVLFYMSNMVPQAPDNNQGVWANFENYCRDLASAGNELLITSGPGGFGGSYLPSGAAAIPGEVWKIVVVVPLGDGTALSRVTATSRVIAIRIPNIAGVRSDPWQKYITSVAQIEADTGFTFFTNLAPATAAVLRTVVDGQTSVGAPTIVAQPVAQSTTVGGNASFAVTATGNTPLSYQWFKDDVSLDGATTATLTLTNVQAADAGYYYVLVSNGVGSTTSNAAALIISGLPPAITTSPSSITTNAGSNATFSVTASGSPVLTYQWRKDGLTIPAATNATLTLGNVQTTNSGTYDVVVTNSVGLATSDAAVLTVTPAAPTIIVSPNSLTLASGSTAVFGVTAEGSAPLSYQWRKAGSSMTDGGNVAGSTTATLTLTNIAATDAAAYDVVVTNVFGMATSTAANLTVNTPPPNAIAWNFGTAAPGVADPSSGLPADISGGTVTQGNNNGTTTMLTNSSVSSGYTGATGSFNAGAAARIGALNTAAGGSAYFQFTLTPVAGKQLAVSGVSFGSRSTSTGPQAYALFTSLDGFAAPIATGTLANTSVWVLQAPAFPPVTGPVGAAITFRIYAYNGAGNASAGTANWRIDDLKVTAATVTPPPAPPAVVSTNPANGASAVSSLAPISVTFSEAVNLGGSWFAITSASTGTVAATVTGGPTTYTLTPPVSFLDGDTVTVTLFAAEITDHQSGALHLPADYTFIFTTAAPLAPTIATQPQSLTVADGGAAAFTVSVGGTPPFGYQWRKAGVPITGNGSAVTATLTLTTVRPADAGGYDCVVTNPAGTATSNIASLTVTAVAPTISVPPAPQSTLVGGTVTFSVAATGTAPLSYQWRKAGVPLADGGSIAGTNSPTLTLTGVGLADAGGYDVIVTNAAGSVTSAAASLTVGIAGQSTLVWDFTTASPTSGLRADITGGTLTQGNNNGTTALITSVSVSSGYAGVSGGNNAGAAARIGALNQAASGSAYFEFTLATTPGQQLVATAINFGARSTSTGPRAFAIFSDVDGFSAPVASGTLANDSVWRLIAPAFTPVTGPTGGTITFRIYGYNGAGNPSAGTANWRIDDLKLAVGTLATAPLIASTTPAAGAAAIPVDSTIAITFNQPVSVTAASFALSGGTSGPINAVLSGGPSTFVLTPTAGLPYSDTVTVTVVASEITEQATGLLHPAADSTFSFTTAAAIPPTITGQPSGQTVTVGDNVTFNVTASGSAPLGYQWQKGGNAIAGATAATLSLTAVTTADAGDYTCVVTNVAGSAISNPATLTVNQAVATVAVNDLTTVFDGSAKAPTVTTSPAGLTVNLTFNGDSQPPVNAGTYAVVATVADPNYTGTGSGTLVITKAPAAVNLANLTQTYNGTARAAAVATIPAGLPVDVSYNGNATAPTNAGSYTVVATIVHPNYYGSVSGTLVIEKAVAVVALGNLTQVYDAAPKPAVATTTPVGLTVQVTYDGNNAVPVNAGSYAVAATVVDANYVGSAAGSLTVSKAPAGVTLANLSQTYDGSTKTVGVTTAPAALAIQVTYNGGATAPVNAGSYAVVATINEANYAGSATGSLVIAKAAATVTLANLSQTYDGSAKTVGVATTPLGLATQVTYNGGATAPVNAGSYAVVATINEANYAGSASGFLVIGRAPATVTLANLNQTYDGTPRPVTVSTTPANLAVAITYNGSASVPTDAGTYAALATVTNPNYMGTATGTLVIGKATATLTLTGLQQVYDGTPRVVTATTAPAGLTVAITYNGSTSAPVAPGTYTVVATITDPDYTDTVTDTLTVTTTVLVRHAPTLNGGLDGSIQVVSAESTTLNGNAWISGDLLVPGTPATQLNGHPVFGGIRDGNGSATPSNYTITLNGNALLRYLVRRTDPIALPVVIAPPKPTGTRDVAINSSGQSAGSFATLRNLTLNGNVGLMAVPPGTYGTLTANGNSGFILGVAGATTPAVYNLQSLTLNGNTQVQIVGPVLLVLNTGPSINGTMGSALNPAWLTLKVFSGGVTLNGNIAFDGFVIAPNGTITINGNSTLNGGVVADRLTINGNGLLNSVDP